MQTDEKSERERLLPGQYNEDRSGNAVTVSWRKPGGRTKMMVAIHIGHKVIEQWGLARGMRAIVERNRKRGALFLSISPDSQGWVGAWKRSTHSESVCFHIPLLELEHEPGMQKAKRAQLVFHEVRGTELMIKLPPWACLVVRG